MTTIAYRDGCMAADTQGTLGSLKFRCRKLFRVNYRDEPILLGHAGAKQACLALMEWLEAGGEDELPTWAYKDDDSIVFQCLAYGKRQGLMLWNWVPQPIQLSDPFLAVGSGAPAALAAMHMGANAHTAVQIAAKVDEGTGGAIDMMKLDD